MLMAAMPEPSNACRSIASRCFTSAKRLMNIESVLEVKNAASGTAFASIAAAR